MICCIFAHHIDYMWILYITDALTVWGGIEFF